MTCHSFAGIYRGVVVDNADPEGRARLRLKIPVLLGTTVTNWVWPCLPAGAALPDVPVGTAVFVMFENCAADSPIWLGVASPSGTVH